MTASAPIPVPFSRRLQQFRSRVLPGLTLLLAAAATVSLWTRHQAVPNAVGEVTGTEMSLASPATGLLVVPPRRLRQYDSVAEGQVIAKLDDQRVRAALLTLKAELDQLRTELQEKTAEAQLQRRAAAGAEPAAFLLQAAPDRVTDPSVPRLRTAIAVHEAKIRELELETESLTVKAPAAGIVTAIHRRPGQVVQVSEPLVTLVLHDSHYITVYVRQHQNIAPSVGMPVDVRPRSKSIQPVTSVIERVGPRVEPVPPQQLRDPKTPEWGIPIRIKLPPELDVTVGDLVDVTIRR